MLDKILIAAYYELYEWFIRDKANPQITFEQFIAEYGQYHGG